MAMKKMVMQEDNTNRQLAFVKGNRPTNSDEVFRQSNSYRDYGQLSPITVANGEEVLRSGGHLVDLKGNDIPDDQAQNYYAVLDGQHRVQAFKEFDPEMNKIVIMESLNTHVSVMKQIAEMNIRTVAWRGTDYMAGSAMTLKESNEVFDFALFLREKGFPLATISLWCLGKNSMKPSMFVKLIGSDSLDRAFDNNGWLSRCQQWYEAAEQKFNDKFLAKKYLITYIIDKYHNAADPTSFTVQMVEKIRSLTEEQAKEIMNPEKVDDQTREQTTINLLIKYLGK